MLASWNPVCCLANSSEHEATITKRISPRAQSPDARRLRVPQRRKLPGLRRKRAMVQNARASEAHADRLRAESSTLVVLPRDREGNSRPRPRNAARAFCRLKQEDRSKYEKRFGVHVHFIDVRA